MNDDPRKILWASGHVSTALFGVRANNFSPMTVTGTNTFIVHEPGAEHALVVDPGPPDVEHLRRVLAVVQERGAKVGGIFITHTHADHIGGTDLLLHLIEHGVGSLEPNQVPAELDGSRFLPQRFGKRARAEFGDTCVPVFAQDLGNCPEGDFEPFEDAPVMSIYNLPGHCDDMVGLLLREDRQLLTSDLIFANWSSVVPYGDGNLGAYFHSLDLIQKLVKDGLAEQLVPSHGFPINQPIKVIEGYRAHRRERLAAVRAAVDSGAGFDATAVVREVYGDVDDPMLMRAAYSSTFAQLEYLAAERGVNFEPDLNLLVFDEELASQAIRMEEPGA